MLHHYLFTLLFVSTFACAETRNDFSYVEVAYADAGCCILFGDESYGNGPKFAASWDFQSRWFVMYSAFSSDGGRDSYTDDLLKYSERALSLGYVFHTSAKTDWYGRIGGVRVDRPTYVSLYYPLDSFTTQSEGDGVVAAFGARHRMAKRFELSWAAEIMQGEVDDLRGIINPRLFVSDQFSIGAQFTIGAEIVLFDLNARWQF